MNLIAVLAISFAVLFGVVVFTVAWAANNAVQKLVGERHEALEEIVNTGCVPHLWRAPYEKKIVELSQECRYEAQLERVRAKAKRRYLHKLDRLRRYLETSSLVESEDTRQAMLNLLEDVRVSWQRQCG